MSEEKENLAPLQGKAIGESAISSDSQSELFPDEEEPSEELKEARECLEKIHDYDIAFAYLFYELKEYGFYAGKANLRNNLEVIRGEASSLHEEGRIDCVRAVVKGDLVIEDSLRRSRIDEQKVLVVNDAFKFLSIQAKAWGKLKEIYGR